jgi:hypothetical protein
MEQVVLQAWILLMEELDVLTEELVVLMQRWVVVYKEMNKGSIAQMEELVAQSPVVTAHAVRYRVVVKPLSKQVSNRSESSQSNGITHRPILEREHGKWNDRDGMVICVALRRTYLHTQKLSRELLHAFNRYFSYTKLASRLPISPLFEIYTPCRRVDTNQTSPLRNNAMPINAVEMVHRQTYKLHDINQNSITPSFISY